MSKYLIQRVSEPIIKQRTIKETNDDERRKQSKSTSKQKQWSCTLNIDQCPSTYDSPTAKPLMIQTGKWRAIGSTQCVVCFSFICNRHAPSWRLWTAIQVTVRTVSCKSRNIQQKTQKENTYNNLIVEKKTKEEPTSKFDHCGCCV